MIANGNKENVIKELNLLKRSSLSGLFSRFSKMVLDVAQTQDKEINPLIVEGQDVKISSEYVNPVSDCLVHIVRNSVGHGIEMPDQRLSSGKDAKGQVTIKVEEHEFKWKILVSHDGAGIDDEKILSAAIAKKIVTHSEAEGWSSKRIRDLIFAPGFSVNNLCIVVFLVGGILS